MNRHSLYLLILPPQILRNHANVTCSLQPPHRLLSLTSSPPFIPNLSSHLFLFFPFSLLHCFILDTSPPPLLLLPLRRRFNQSSGHQRGESAGQQRPTPSSATTRGAASVAQRERGDMAGLTRQPDLPRALLSRRMVHRVQAPWLSERRSVLYWPSWWLVGYHRIARGWRKEMALFPSQETANLEYGNAVDGVLRRPRAPQGLCLGEV
ncbi:uncharacterized protein IWZ02DRAFT_248829 [Phyllosticta citriasiana]|uniref:uncharacterized protein n=1 Tax=Phyllosticta citriasiana TaxID=595635 RepID=UPI0030FD6E83